MGRPSLQVTTLHEHSLDKLIEIKNKYANEYARLLLTTVIMRYKGSSPTEIKEIVGRSNVTINNYINKWNKLGLNALKDNRGSGYGSRKFTAEMEQDLIDVLLNKKPTDFELISHSWNCKSLAYYIELFYQEKFSDSTIRNILIKNKFSFKRAQAKPTKADKAEQIRFKKNVQNTRFFRIRK